MNSNNNNHGRDDACSKASADTTADRVSDAEAVSLLDSCESEDEEDCVSIVACGSEDYSQYIDETGRQQDDKNDVVGVAVDSPQPGTPSIVNTTAPPAPVTPDPPAAVLIRDTSKSPPPVSRPDGLAFDLNQPWERSLLRQLDAVQQKQQQHPTLPLVGSNGKNSHQQLQPPRRRELMLLGHTESRDFAMDFDQDGTDFSLDTNASSTLPSKAQLIHRTLLNTMPQARVVYHVADDDDNDDDDNDDDDDHERMVLSQQHYLRMERQRMGRDSATSSLTSYMTMQAEDDRDEVSFPAAKKIPDELPGRRKAAAAIITEHQPFLEMEASVNENKNDDVHNDDDEEDSSNMDLVTAANALPDPGCFCLGYDMLEYVLPPPTTSYNTSKKNQRRQLSGVMRPSQLPRVEEDPVVPTAVFPEIIDVTHVKVIRRHHQYRNNNQKSEPEGSYVYYSTAAASARTTTRRQGVDL